MQTWPKVIGHRGIPYLAPENTIASFAKSLELGAEGIELDVHLSKDNEMVVCHDEKVNRTTNGKGFIKDLTLEELRRLDAGSWYSDSFSGQRIPLLSEVLDLVVDTSVMVNIELKTGIVSYPGLVEKVVELIRRYKLVDRVIISSFNHYSLIETMKIEPKLSTAILYSAGLYEPWAYAAAMDVKGLHPAYHSVNESGVAGAKAQGVFVNPWTVDEPQKMEQLAAMGIDGIITNRTDLLVEVLGR